MLPTLLVRAEAGPFALDPSFRAGLEWPQELKDALVERGRMLADAALRSDDGAAVLGSAALDAA